MVVGGWGSQVDNIPTSASHLFLQHERTTVKAHSDIQLSALHVGKNTLNLAEGLMFEFLSR